VATGYVHSCVIKNGQVGCWGSSNFNQLDGLTDKDESVLLKEKTKNAWVVVAGGLHTCTMAKDIVCWGNNSQGQLDVPKDLFKFIEQYRLKGVGVGVGSGVSGGDVGKYKDKGKEKG